MTVVLSFLDNDGCAIVADKRISRGCEITSDDFTKIFPVGPYLTLAFAGDLGLVQAWVRHAVKHKVKTLSQLLSEQPAGEFEYIVYSSTEHMLWSGDGGGSCLPAKPLASLGNGSSYCQGYLAASGLGDTTEERFALLATSIEQCAKVDLSVSSAVDLVYIARTPARRKPRSRVSENRAKERPRTPKKPKRTSQRG